MRTRTSPEDVKRLANWNAKAPAQVEIPFVVALIVLQDFTGVPLLDCRAAGGRRHESVGESGPASREVMRS